MLFSAASSPLLVASALIVARSHAMAPLSSVDAATLLMAACVGGGAVAALGSYLFVSKPMRGLDASIKHWRPGIPFATGTWLAEAPVEVRNIAVSFQNATSALEQREADLRISVERQELLMQEIHHRVKNNLQIVASLMNLQASRIRQPEAKAEFQSARDRIRALATLHRHLYANGDLHTINMRSFLVELCEQLFHAMGENAGDRIKLEIEAPELQMSSDQAVPLSLIVTEAVSNAIKYAFPAGRRGRIEVRLIHVDDDAELSIVDDGVGIPAGKVEADAGPRDGIGIMLIRGFARQLGATLRVEENQGTRYFIRMRLARGCTERAPPMSAPPPP